MRIQSPNLSGKTYDGDGGGHSNRLQLGQHLSPSVDAHSGSSRQPDRLAPVADPRASVSPNLSGNLKGQSLDLPLTPLNTEVPTRRRNGQNGGHESSSKTARPVRAPELKVAARHPDCHCKRAIHVHGSRTTYVVHKCRCNPCREDNRIQAEKRRRAKLYGRYDRFVDGNQVRAHLRQLMDQGMGWKRIAAAAGVGASTVYPILYGKYLDQPAHPEHRPLRRKVQRDVAERLLAVTLDLGGGVVVDATGTRRRVQALATRGWSLSRIAAALDITRSNFHLHTDQRDVTIATRDAVKALYEQWWDQEPSAVNRFEQAGITRARREAAAHGWAPPMAWDDDTIDNPEATPNLGESPGSRGVHIDDVRYALDLHDTLESAAAWLGVSVPTLRARLTRDRIRIPARVRVATDEAHYHRQRTAA